MVLTTFINNEMGKFELQVDFDYERGERGDLYSPPVPDHTSINSVHVVARKLSDNTAVLREVPDWIEYDEDVLEEMCLQSVYDHNAEGRAYARAEAMGIDL